ncbi:MAG: rhodanese-like domain-containing protein [Planctomycetota bacterium]
MGVRRIDAERAKELLDADEGYVFVDVRTEEEFLEGHIPTARNIPLYRRGAGGIGLLWNNEFQVVMEQSFEKGDKIILGCHKGGRSAKAADLLAATGFSNLFDMRGGFLGETDIFGNITFPGWVTRGFEATKECCPTDLYRHPVAEVSGQGAGGGRKRR